MKRYVFRTAACAVLGAVFLAFGHLRAGAAEEAGAHRFLSDVTVQIDGAAAADNRLEPDAIRGQVARFLDSHQKFTLNDLNNLKLPAADGREVLLQEVATVQVEFHRAK